MSATAQNRRGACIVVEDVLTGFVDAKGDALGRPVGVAVDQAGALLVADAVYHQPVRA